MFATQMGNDPDDSARIIHKAPDAEIDLVDCVDRYGDAEEIVGMPMSDDSNEQGGSRRWITTAIGTPCAGSAPTASTSTTSTGPDPMTDLEETLRPGRH